MTLENTKDEIYKKKSNNEFWTTDANTKYSAYNRSATL